MILVVGTIRLPEGALEANRAAMETVISETRKEAGCIRYAYAIDTLDPQVMHVSEAWESMDALKAHFTAPHMAEWQKVVAGIGVIERDLKLYDTDEGTPL